MGRFWPGFVRIRHSRMCRAFLSKNGAYKIHAWDDYLIKSNLYLKNRFITGLNTVDYIVMSPGINILKSKFKKILLKNKKKIITDLDLFFLKNIVSFCIHYLNFRVANPIIAKIIDIIQNLITTVDSGHPFFSK